MELFKFGFEDQRFKHRIKEFVLFHWAHYRNDGYYIPLLNMEYFGNRLFGVKGFFERRNPLYRHTQIQFFMIKDREEILGRCCAYIDGNFVKRWGLRAGFFGFFEVIDDIDTARLLLDGAAQYLKKEGMDLIRGPQNLPVNEATPGIMVEGFQVPPVIYYHYNKPYYARLLENIGYKPKKRYISLGLDAAKIRNLLLASSDNSNLSIEDLAIKRQLEKLERIVKRITKEGRITVKPLTKKGFSAQAETIWRIYNEAWKENWGFVPWEKEEFCHIIEEEKMVIDFNLFLIGYVDDKPAAFFGVVPNLNEVMRPIPGLKRFDLLRGAKMFLLKSRVHTVRVGYFGVLPRYRRKGLDAAIFWMAIKYWLANLQHITKADIGFILEDNKRMIKPVEDFGGKKERTFVMYEKAI